MYISTFNSMANNLAEYIQKNNLKSMVLGLSGGIDSTLCALICNEALKQLDDAKLILVSLPSNTNDNMENDIAWKLGTGLMEMHKDDNKVIFQIHSIEHDYKVLHESLSIALRQMTVNSPYEMQPLQNGNIKARIRMMYLYNIASVSNGIVIDTDNMTEHNLGFWTIHGDVGDVNPIGRLWKTDIYNLAKECAHKFDFNNDYNTSVYEALIRSIEITPTDGNGVKAGGDLAQIAPTLKYEDVDKILQNEVLEFDEAKCIEKRNELSHMYGEDAVNAVIKRHKNSEYKRRRQPIVLMPF
ncbi:MAG: NAD synthetase [Wendovervirus sonii]|uniref:NAD synthetase n=1 Tax=phage Lak_Megaphage_Sonny TaxID=3109229 RepID=A0ABZ0Z5P5_9CAUD|nr:MAG: NAD synthetase [phage Lak_Megaphage_Sonny]